MSLLLCCKSVGHKDNREHPVLVQPQTGSLGLYKRSSVRVACALRSVPRARETRLQDFSGAYAGYVLLSARRRALFV
jgi:hypothetical protein